MNPTNPVQPADDEPAARRVAPPMPTRAVPPAPNVTPGLATPGVATSGLPAPGATGTNPFAPPPPPIASADAALPPPPAGPGGFAAGPDLVGSYRTDGYAPGPYPTVEPSAPAASIVIGGGTEWQQWTDGAPLQPAAGLPAPPANGWTEVHLGGQSSARSGSRRNARRLAVIGATAAVLAGGLATVRMLRPSPTGSATPTAAVEQMIHALERRDLIGATDTFPAYDRALIAEAVSGYAEAPATNGKKIDLRALPGYTLAVTGLETTTDQVTDRIALVRLAGGHYRATVDLRELYRSVGMEAMADRLSGVQLMPAVDGDLAQLGTPIQVATVRDAEGWHVSLEYTVAELARRDAGMPAPDPAQRIESIGSGSPEAAARSMIDATASADWRKVIALTADGEADVLHDYGHLFLDRLPPSDTRLTVSAFESHTKKVAGQTVVVVDHLAVTGPNGAIDLARVGSGCLTMTVTDSGDTKTTKSCVADVVSFLRDAKLPEAIVAQYETEILPAFDDSGFVTVERGGSWYVSPLRTVASLSVPAAIATVSWWKSVGGEAFGGASFGDPNADASTLPTSTALPADRAAQSRARSAEAVASTVYADRGSYAAIDEAALSDADPDLFSGTNRGAAAELTSDISWNLTGPAGAETGLVLAARSRSGRCYLIRNDEATGTTYAQYDASSAPCVAVTDGLAWTTDSAVAWSASTLVAPAPISATQPPVSATPRAAPGAAPATIIVPSTTVPGRTVMAPTTPALDHATFAAMGAVSNNASGAFDDAAIGRSLAAAGFELNPEGTPSADPNHVAWLHRQDLPSQVIFAVADLPSGQCHFARFDLTTGRGTGYSWYPLAGFPDCSPATVIRVDG